MSLHLPARRTLASTIVRSTVVNHASPRASSLLPRTQQRNFLGGLFGKAKKKKQESNAIDRFAKDMDEEQKKIQMMGRLTDRRKGDTIFDDELQPRTPSGEESESQGSMSRERAAANTKLAPSTLREHQLRSQDPDPRWRVRWQKKKVMQMVRNGKELSPQEKRRRSEREIDSKSEIIPTSTKKLMHLSRQIAGKTLDDALNQMRFSKKKMAREVRLQLEIARDQAITERGMGLAKPKGELLSNPKKIQTKDGKFMEVTDPSGLYVDQSWVNKGPWRFARMEYKGRSRMAVQWSPTARINIRLKEEQTRIRQHEERVEKAAKAKPWVHLPNRPVYHQRPWYSW